MRHFRFRLQKALDHALHIERLKQKELAAARRALAEADRSLFRLIRARRDTLYRGRPAGSLTAGRLREKWAYAARLRRDIQVMKGVVEKLASEMENKRRSLLKASRSRTLLERQRERELAEYMAEMMHEEQAIQDETGTLRHLRAV